LTAATAEQVFGWKNVHKHDGQLVGRKQDKLGRWRTAKVPDYANDPVQAYAIDERMKQFGRSEQYLKELSKITKANNLPPEWATPKQHIKNALGFAIPSAFLYLLNLREALCHALARLNGWSSQHGHHWSTRHFLFERLLRRYRI
jgi:hypothetical protein